MTSETTQTDSRVIVAVGVDGVAATAPMAFIGCNGVARLMAKAANDLCHRTGQE